MSKRKDTSKRAYGSSSYESDFDSISDFDFDVRPGQGKKQPRKMKLVEGTKPKMKGGRFKPSDFEDGFEDDF